jgi:hypothetical protein
MAKKIIKKKVAKKAKVKKAVKKPAKKKVVKKPAKKAPAKKQVKSKAKVVVKKPATKKKVVTKKPKAEKPKERYKRLKDGSLRVYGWIVKSAPNTKFPELVSVENIKARIQKRFITLEKGIKFIEERESEKLINSGGKSVINELKSLGLGPAVDIIADEKAEATKTVSIETTGQTIESIEAEKEEIELDADQ